MILILQNLKYVLHYKPVTVCATKVVLQSGMWEKLLSVILCVLTL
jgi:hypothetical protein